MKPVHKHIKFLTTFFVAFIFFFVIKISHAGYGPGYTGGWDRSVDGLEGVLNDSSYINPASYYSKGSTITVTATVKNPSDNTLTISNKQFYAIVTRVTHSPKTTSITSGNTSLSEDTLYLNHMSGNDTQTSYTSGTAQSLTLSPGQTGTLSYSFTPANTGYYQIDFTDQAPGASYAPGHIVAAGFVRVVDTSSDDDDDDNDGDDDDNDDDNDDNDDNDDDDTDSDNDSSTSNNSGNNSGSSTNTASVLGTSTTVAVATLGTGTGGQVLGLSETATAESTPSAEAPLGTSTVSPEILGTTTSTDASCNEPKTYWWLIWILDIALTIFVMYLIKRTNRTTVAGILGRALVGILATVLWYIFKCSCSDLNLCIWSPVVFLAVFILGHFIFKPPKQLYK